MEENAYSLVVVLEGGHRTKQNSDYFLKHGQYNNFV